MPTNVNHYYNRYSPAKKYHFVSWLTGRAVQSAELNEIQSYFQDMLARLGGTLFKNGTILQGCSLVQNALTVTITPGTVYLDGKVLPVDAQTLELSGAPTEVISLYAKKTIIQPGDIADDDTDPDLKDPAVGKPNYGKPGAERIKLDVLWTLGSALPPGMDGGLVPVFTFTSGNLLSENARAEVDIVNKNIARRTYDLSGNYLVDGLRVSVKDPVPASDDLVISVTAGKAVIKGFEHIRETSADLPVTVKKAVDGRLTRSAASFAGTTTTGNIDFAAGRSVKKITNVNLKWKTTVEVTRGTTSNGTDPIHLIGFPLGSIDSVTKVNWGATVYAPNNYTVNINTNEITWDNGALDTAEPPANEPYTVELIYKGDLPPESPYVDLVDNKAVLTPLPGTTFETTGNTVEVTYEYFLNRVDLVQMLPNGTISVKTGQADDIGIAPLPDAEALPLAEYRVPAKPLGTPLLLAPDDAAPTKPYLKVTNYGLYRVTQREIRELIRRLEQQEYNAASDDLNSLALQRGGANVKGAFSDGFVSANKAIAAVATPLHIDVARGLLMLPSTHTVYRPAVAGTSTAQTFQSLATLPYTEKTVTPVSAVTRLLRLNPYGIFNDLPALEAYGNEDLFQETDHAKVPAEALKPTKLITGVFGEVPDTDVANPAAVKLHQANTVAYSIPRTLTLKGRNFGVANDLEAYLDGRRGRLVPLGASKPGSKVIGKVRVKVSNAAGHGEPIPGNDITLQLITSGGTQFVTYRVAGEEATSDVATFLAAAINADGTGFRALLSGDASASGEEVTFVVKDDVTATLGLPPVAPGSAVGGVIKLVTEALETGTMLSDATGAFEATFEAPGGIPEGDRTITVKNATKTALARYAMRGADRPVWDEPPAHGYAPSDFAAAAQTFVSSANPLLKVGLYFLEVDASKPLEVQIREVANGRPTSKILARKMLFAADVLLPTDTSSATKRMQTLRQTVVTFDDPVVSLPGTELALVLATGAKDTWSVALARTGEQDMMPGGAGVGKNPYAEGRFFTGTLSTWDEWTDADLKHDLIEMVAAPGASAVLEFSPVTVSATGLILRASQGAPVGARIAWEYRLADTGLDISKLTWKPLTPGIRTDLFGVNTKVFLRATLTGGPGAMPWVNTKVLDLVTLSMATSGYYESVPVDFSPQKFTSLNAYLKVKALPGQEVKVYYALSTDGSTYGAFTQIDNTIPDRTEMGTGLDGYTEYKWAKSGFSNQTQGLKLQVELTSNAAGYTPLVKHLITSVS